MILACSWKTHPILIHITDYSSPAQTWCLIVSVSLLLLGTLSLPPSLHTGPSFHDLDCHPIVTLDWNSTKLPCTKISPALSRNPSANFPTFFHVFY